MSTLQDVFRSIHNLKNTVPQNIQAQSAQFQSAQAQMQNPSAHSARVAGVVSQAQEQDERNCFQRVVDAIIPQEETVYTTELEKVNPSSLKICGKAKCQTGDFSGADNKPHRVAVEPAQIYNVLSDNNMQINARFQEHGTESGDMALSEIGIVAHDPATGKEHKIQVSKDGTVSVDDVAMPLSSDARIQVDPAIWYINHTDDGGRVEIKMNDYVVNVDLVDEDNPDTARLGLSVMAPIGADDVAPHGLLGQWAEHDFIYDRKDALGRQWPEHGGGPIERYNGLYAGSTDVETVGLYKVGGLFDTDFANFNVYDDGRPGRLVPDEDLPPNVY